MPHTPGTKGESQSGSDPGSLPPGWQLLFMEAEGPTNPPQYIPPGTPEARNPNRISVPFTPPNPYDIVSSGSDEKEAVSSNMEHKKDAQYIPYSPETVNPIEQDPNQLPQVVVEDAPEVVGAANNTIPSTSPMFGTSKREDGRASSPPPPAAPAHETKPSEAEADKGSSRGCCSWLWGKSKRSTGLIIVGVVVIAVVVGIATGVAVAMANRSDQGYVDHKKPHETSGESGSNLPSPHETNSGLTSDSFSEDETAASGSSKTSANTTSTPTSSAKPAVCLYFLFRMFLAIFSSIYYL